MPLAAPVTTAVLPLSSRMDRTLGCFKSKVIPQRGIRMGGGAMGRLAGKTAIITGGAHGQGEAEVRRFVAEGANVVIGDLLDEAGEKLAAELGDAATYLHMDVSQQADWDRAVAAAERHGPLRVRQQRGDPLDPPDRAQTAEGFEKMWRSTRSGRSSA